MDAEHLASWLRHRLKVSSVEHVLNWGGFVNQSFTVIDGPSRRHLKITNDLDNIASLKRWNNNHTILEDRYRAPKLLEWIDLPEIGFAGLMFEHLEGKTASLPDDPSLLKDLLALAGRLHHDPDLRETASKTYLDHFAETYIERFTADLDAVANSPLPFVPPALFTWMRDETAALLQAASKIPSFHSPATQAVHGDLHEGNVLVTADSWFILDWDDLAIGDPAIDLAVLLWPMVWHGDNWKDYFTPEPDLAQRLELCFRAQLLDEVVDPLADYIEAHSIPSKQDEMRRAKRALHEEALAKYRSAYR